MGGRAYREVKGMKKNYFAVTNLIFTYDLDAVAIAIYPHRHPAPTGAAGAESLPGDGQFPVDVPVAGEGGCAHPQ